MTFTIYLIDDDMDFVSEIATALEDQFEVIRSVNEDVEAGSLRKAFRYQPDLIIMDVKKASVRDYYLLKELRWLSQTMPIIILSPFEDIQNALVAIRMGANEYIVRPLSTENLLRKVKEYLTTNA